MSKILLEEEQNIDTNESYFQTVKYDILSALTPLLTKLFLAGILVIIDKKEPENIFK